MSLQDNLLRWFQKNQRPLPWRKHYQPYEVWVSEIMLQQTQMDTVLPYFERWMKVFPTLEALAKADEKKVLKLWEGLGYYSRARNLHATAKQIMKEHGGQFPSDFEKIRSLKGIGRYTAGAIASIAFNQEKPIVDGNVLRVLSRVYAISKPIDVPKNTETFWTLQEKLIPKGKARYFNQALMELGALVCAKENPLCASCPINPFCKAYKKNKVENYPVRIKKKKAVKIIASALVLSKNDKFLIQRRPLGKIMGGLWEFPEWKLARNKKLSSTKIKALALENLENEFGNGFGDLKSIGRIKRNYTHHLETLHVFSVAANGLHSKRGWPTAWVSKQDFRTYPFSSAHAKIAALLN